MILKSLKITQIVFGQNLDFLGVLGHQIYKFSGNLITLYVVIRKGGSLEYNVKVSGQIFCGKKFSMDIANKLSMVK